MIRRDNNVCKITKNEAGLYIGVGRAAFGEF
jgi:hypothetical protein